MFSQTRNNSAIQAAVQLSLLNMEQAERSDKVVDGKEGDRQSDLCFFTEILSDEVLLMITQHLDLVDVINLSQTCVKFNNLLKDRAVCGDLRLRWHIKISRLDFVKFLRDRQRAALIVKLNLNDVYWVPSGVLRNIVRPLVNLQALHVAGTQLRWTHLSEVLTSLENLEALSWSWDSRLEVCGGRLGEKGRPTDVSTLNSISSGDLPEIKVALERLKYLLLHIPSVQNPRATSYAAPVGISNLISLCQNLEHLWIVSWPKTEAERKMMEIFGEHGFPSELKLLKLRTFTVRAMGAPRIHVPKLISTVLHSISESSILNSQQLEHLWLDHPLLSWSPWNTIVNCVRGRNAGVLNPWPRLNFDHVETLSLPLIEGALHWWEGNTFENVKHLQITDGLPRVVNLSGMFDRATKLQSIVIKAFNIKLDWLRFVEAHPDLVEISVCLDGYFPYPEICVALARLPRLRRLSLPLYALLEIRDASIVDQYRAALELEGREEVSPKPRSIEFEDYIFGKKSRVAHKTVTQSNNLSISGLDLVTHSCSKIEEFELGFSTKTRPGFMIMKSLSSLCKWKNLRRLTLDDIPIQDGQFLVNVATSCRIEFLSLKFLGPRAKCCYMDDLCKALKSMTHLRDFRFEQNYIGSTLHLFRSLQSCSRLQRFLLWAKSNDQPLDSNSCLGMTKACKDLTMLYITIGATTKSTCETLRKTIESMYKSSRPALSVIIRKGPDTDDDTAPPVYPSVHYREMVVFAPQIGQHIDFDVSI